MKIIRKTIKLFLLLGLVSVGVNTYRNNPTVRMATNDSISTLKEKISTLDASDLNPLKLVPPKVSDRPSDQMPSSESDNQQANQPVTSNSSEGQNHETSSKQTWNQAKANVFIDISNNDELVNATREAMNSWNKTGAFTFKETTNKNEANIVVQQVEDDTTSAAGVTTTSYNPLTNHLLKAQVKLNTYYLQNENYDYSYQRVVNTAEHELGHAIGLQHTNTASVMYPAGSYYSIQEQDINAARDLYKSTYAA